MFPFKKTTIFLFLLIDLIFNIELVGISVSC